jgi:hypothetical protein
MATKRTIETVVDTVLTAELIKLIESTPLSIEVIIHELEVDVKRFLLEKNG